jgi:aspartate aminotransferase
LSCSRSFIDFEVIKFIAAMTSQKDAISLKARQLQISPTLAINELVNEQLRKGKSVAHLGFGEATFPLPETVLEAHRNSSDITSYLPVAGLTKLREVHANNLMRNQCPGMN